MGSGSCRPGFSLRPLSVVALLVLAGCAGPPAPDVRVAASANFYATALELAADFGARSGLRVEVVSGSTGKHVAQILQGAPFDLLLAADTTAPRVLDASGGVQDAWIYAYGALMAVSRDGNPSELLMGDRVALANAALAPYGRAAEEVLGALESRALRVRGENVSQAYQMVAAGGVPVGLVSRSQLPAATAAGYRVWSVPDSLHTPIVQGAALLRDVPAGASEFADWLRGPEAAAIIRDAGYIPGVPESLPITPAPPRSDYVSHAP